MVQANFDAVPGPRCAVACGYARSVFIHPPAVPGEAQFADAIVQVYTAACWKHYENC